MAFSRPPFRTRNCVNSPGDQSTDGLSGPSPERQADVPEVVRARDGARGPGSSGCRRGAPLAHQVWRVGRGGLTRGREVGKGQAWQQAGVTRNAFLGADCGLRVCKGPVAPPP